MHTYIHTCMHVCMYACMHMHARMHTYIHKSIWHTLERASPGADLLLSPQPDASLTARFVKTGPVPPQMHQFTSQLQMKPVPNYTVLVDRGRPLNKEPVSCDSRSAAFNGS